VALEPVTLSGVFELNLPNLLTVIRILLVPVLVAALLQEAGPGESLAAAVFAVASFTDALDGWIARRQKKVSTFGKLMDPLADKLLVTAALVSLVSLQRLSAWVAMVIIAREFAVTGLRQLAMEHGDVIPASIWGKVKTVAQVAMVLLLITVDGSPTWLDVFVWVTTAITVVSGADYFFGFRSLVQARQARLRGEPQA
jgi:CDP-diacylglycerol--glycerol-3-phosphate 3-phosphatidyltransferase